MFANRLAVCGPTERFLGLKFEVLVPSSNANKYAWLRSILKVNLRVGTSLERRRFAHHPHRAALRQQSPWRRTDRWTQSQRFWKDSSICARSSLSSENMQLDVTVVTISTRQHGAIGFNMDFPE